MATFISKTGNQKSFSQKRIAVAPVWAVCTVLVTATMTLLLPGRFIAPSSTTPATRSGTSTTTSAVANESESTEVYVGPCQVGGISGDHKNFSGFFCKLNVEVAENHAGCLTTTLWGRLPREHHQCHGLALAGRAGGVCLFKDLR